MDILTKKSETSHIHQTFNSTSYIRLIPRFCRIAPLLFICSCNVLSLFLKAIIYLHAFMNILFLAAHVCCDVKMK